MKLPSLTVLINLLFLILPVTGHCATTTESAATQAPCAFNPDTIVLNLPTQELSQGEKNSLLQLLGQEKLFKEVYTKFQTQWPTEFKNAPVDEERHANGMKALLTKYQLTDPNADQLAGMFAETKLTKLYNDFVAQGQTSQNAALTAAVALEEMNLAALNQALATTDNLDLQFVYKQLTKGARNHLRGLMSLLKPASVQYQPTYLSATEFENIIKSPKEKHVYDDPTQIPCKSPQPRNRLPIEGAPYQGQGQEPRSPSDYQRSYSMPNGHKSEHDEEDD